MYTEQALDFNTFARDTSGKNYVNLVTSTGVQNEYIFSKRAVVKRIMLTIHTTAATSTANAVVTMRRRPTPGSASSQVTIGTLTVPTGTAAPKVIYKDVTPVTLAPGESIALDLTTQGTDASSAAGTAYASWEACVVHEQPANETNMLASA